MSRPNLLIHVLPRLRWLRNLVLGVVVVVGLWLTVMPEGDAARWAQLSLGALAVAGVTMSGLPMVAVIITACATGAAWLVGVTADPFVLTGFAVFVLAERRGSRRYPWWMFTAAAVVALASLGLGADGVEDRFRGMLLSAVVLAASWMLGVRTRQARLDTEARSRAEERLRLARDVHDVLSHSLGAIGVRAGVAAHVASLGEPELRGVMREIESDARSSLSDLKTLLQRERSPDDAPSSLPLSASLADIALRAEQAGVITRIDTDGETDMLPAPVRTTVLRLVQEAVTNVLRHASASSLTITLRIVDDSVSVEVRDDGEGASAGFREGHGMTGMRERVALLDGTLSVNSSSSGLTVSARLPLSGAAEVDGAL